MSASLQLLAAHPHQDGYHHHVQKACLTQSPTRRTLLDDCKLQGLSTRPTTRCRNRLHRMCRHVPPILGHQACLNALPRVVIIQHRLSEMPHQVSSACNDHKHFDDPFTPLLRSPPLAGGRRDYCLDSDRSEAETPASAGPEKAVAQAHAFSFF